VVLLHCRGLRVRGQENSRRHLEKKKKRSSERGAGRSEAKKGCLPRLPGAVKNPLEWGIRKASRGANEAAGCEKGGTDRLEAPGKERGFLCAKRELLQRMGCWPHS